MREFTNNIYSLSLLRITQACPVKFRKYPIYSLFDAKLALKNATLLNSIERFKYLERIYYLKVGISVFF
jgi:hypothetical protein